MKDGRTRLAHKLEHAVDMDTGAVVGVTVQTMDGGDTASLPVTLDEAERRLAEAGAEAQEVVADKGYHSDKTMTGVKDRGMRSYVSEPNRGRRKWKGKRDAQTAVYADRRRIRGRRGKPLLRRRGEKVERAFTHMPETGGMRRVHVRGQENIRKRMLVHAAAFNLGLLMRKLYRVGTPRGLQGLATVQAAFAARLTTAVSPDSSPVSPPYRPSRPVWTAFARSCRLSRPKRPPSASTLALSALIPCANPAAWKPHFFHGLLGSLRYTSATFVSHSMRIWRFSSSHQIPLARRDHSDQSQ